MLRARLHWMLLLAVPPLAAGSACGYDWTVRDAPSGSEAGADGSPSPDDAGEEPDGAVDASRLDSGDAGVDGADFCDALGAALDASAQKAQACTQGAVPAHCTAFVTDECDCKRYVRTAGSNESKAYEAAISQFKAAGCASPWCKACQPSASGVCILQPTARCSP